MKTIGLIGGITPESTILYYRILNKLAASKYGESHSAKVIVNSVDFGEISQLQSENRWDLLNEIMSKAALSLEHAGASCILICANTMHLSIEAVKAVVNIPVIHIAEATSKQIITKGLKKVALLGTKYTMEKTFFIDVLKTFGIEAIIPGLEDRDDVHGIIYNELSKGVLNPESKLIYQEVIKRLIAQGAEGVILGCTEIPLLIKQEDVSVPVFDTTSIHASAAFDLASN
ncbi:aspartate/glutamate racemase family protein [Algibacter lectus]|uniref:aspartate/glutamate racemase family protein n=1 Tax=Algibacter lectus TaxID=221126 RepID=UPI0026EDDBD2|nr:aspartate/glutamate racemase family protein [Algibacter lectus]MDO7137816.1 aspartate/glutamate racemase family protein [Algibacter lectus]